MKRAIATLCTFALAGFGAIADATVSDPQQQQQRQKGPIRVQTDLVSILASVTDNKGEPVIGLPETAFQLSEEGIAQKIVRFEPQTNRPLDLALMLDASGSEGGGADISPWETNVLRNAAVQKLRLGRLAAGHHRLRLIYGDPGVVFEHLAVTFAGAPAAYPVPPETGCGRYALLGNK